MRERDERGREGGSEREREEREEGEREERERERRERRGREIFICNFILFFLTQAAL